MLGFPLENPMKLPLMLFTLSALTLGTGCQETASANAADVAEVRADANEDIDEARQDAGKDVAEANLEVMEARADHDASSVDADAELTATESAAMVVRARANFDIDIAEARGRHEIAKERCGTLTGVEKEACFSTADAEHAADEAAATATRDASLVAAEYH